MPGIKSGYFDFALKIMLTIKLYCLNILDCFSIISESITHKITYKTIF